MALRSVRWASVSHRMGDQKCIILSSSALEGILKPSVPAASVVVSTHQFALWGATVSLCVSYKEGLCPHSNDIRFIMTRVSGRW
jgi:hypothetical protein